MSRLVRSSLTPATVTRGQRSSSAGRPAWAQSEVPELRLNSVSPVEVVLGRSARQAILDDLFSSTRLDQLESGGFLHGRRARSWEKKVEILGATRTGENALRRSDSLMLDTEQWARRERAYAAEGYDFPLCGLWHCHPGTRDGSPSDADLASLLGVLDWHEKHGRSANFSVGLIYAASEVRGDTWARPHLHGYVVRREGYSRHPVCEPANVRERR